MRRALAIDERATAPDHPNVATASTISRRLLQATNRLAEAEPLMRRALAIDETSFGPDHPNRGDWPRPSRAFCFEATNRLAAAEPLYRRALAIDETSYGPDHPNVARASTISTACFGARTASPKASRLCGRALAIDEKSRARRSSRGGSWTSTISRGCFDAKLPVDGRAADAAALAIGRRRDSRQRPAIGVKVREQSPRSRAALGKGGVDRPQAGTIARYQRPSRREKSALSCGS